MASTRPKLSHRKKRSNNLTFSTKNHQITTDKLFDGFKNPISDKIQNARSEDNLAFGSRNNLNEFSEATNLKIIGGLRVGI